MRRTSWSPKQGIKYECHATVQMSLLPHPESCRLHSRPSCYRSIFCIRRADIHRHWPIIGAQKRRKKSSWKSITEKQNKLYIYAQLWKSKKLVVLFDIYYLFWLCPYSFIVQPLSAKKNKIKEKKRFESYFMSNKSPFRWQHNSFILDPMIQTDVASGVFLSLPSSSSKFSFSPLLSFFS